MKNYIVKATRSFKDKVEDKERVVNDIFECDKERYEFLKRNNAVELIEIIEEKEDIVEDNNIVEEPKVEIEKVEEVVFEAPVEEKEDKVVKEIITKKKKSSKK